MANLQHYIGYKLQNKKTSAQKLGGREERDGWIFHMHFLCDR